MPRRWTEETPEPPVDLRLVPAALAVWVGCLIPRVGSQATWWAAVSGAIITGVLIWRRPPWRAGALAASACLVAALASAALQQGAEADNPLAAAADRKSWATIEVIVNGYPEQVSSGFQRPDDGPQDDDSRWRVPVTVIDVRVADSRWSLAAETTVYGRGSDWGTVLPGQQLSTAGRLGKDQRAGITIAARSPPDVSTAPPWWFVGAGTVREHLSATAAELDGGAAGLLPGLVIGDDSRIDQALEDAAKATGLTHLLVVSGSHFAILCGGAVIALRSIGPRVAAVGGAAVLVGLVVLVGPQPSVLRAAVMGAVTLLALLSGRARTSVPALATAVIGLLLFDPRLATSAGFALSVVATGGLVLLAPAWAAWLRDRGVPRGWAELIAIPVAAQVVTLPIIVAISGTVSVVGALANLVVTPVVAPALILGMLSALSGPWWPEGARALAAVAAPLLDWIGSTARTLARWPAATLPWPATPAAVLGLTGLLILGVGLLRHRRIRAWCGAVMAGVAVVLIPFQSIAPGWPAPGWMITACDIGQGDAMVLATGEPGTAVVVDTGPEPGALDACLERLAVGTIPLLVLTHLHADHIDGIAGALDGRSVGAILVGPGREPVWAWRQVVQLAHERGIPVIQFPIGTQWSTGGLTLAVLGPSRAFRGTDSDPNNESVVMRAEISGHRILLTGDIEIEAQQALLNARIDLRADILKVPHHGSAKISDRFLEQVGAAVAVIGVGADNDYGHPSPRLLEALARNGVRTVLRTDEQGDVAVGVEGGQLVTVARDR